MPDDTTTAAAVGNDEPLQGLQPLPDEPEAPEPSAPPVEARVEPEAPAPKLEADTAKPDEKTGQLVEIEMARQQLRSAQQSQQEQQLLLKQAQAQAAFDQEQAELQRYQWELEQQGYDQGTVQSSVQQRQQQYATQRQLAQAQQHAKDVAAVMGREAEAKVSVAADLSKKYNVPITDLLKFNTPEEMQIAGLEAQVAKAQQAAHPAQKFDAETATPGEGGSAASRRAAIRSKNGPLSDAEHAELGKSLSYTG
jgi:hypothetical protein